MSTVLEKSVELLAQMTCAEKAQFLHWAAQDLSGTWPGVERRAEICGGEACIVRTRIPVWLLEHARTLGASEAKLLRDYPTLTAQDLVNAWAYARANRAEIEAAIAANETDCRVSKIAMTRFEDVPKLLGNDAARTARFGQLRENHVAPLTTFVEALRLENGPSFGIPYFDPWDGGIEARVLYLLEAPGAKAVQSGFISRNNPDETAKNFFELNMEAGIPRHQTVTWNIVPWYIGTETRIRAAQSDDIAAGARSLERLLKLLPNLKVVVLIGRKAESKAKLIQSLRTNVKVFLSPHPSPLFVNNAPGNRNRILTILREVRLFLDQPSAQ